MSCVNTFPKHSMDGGQYGTMCALPSPPVQDTRHLWTFPKWQGTDNISTLQL